MSSRLRLLRSLFALVVGVWIGVCAATASAQPRDLQRFQGRVRRVDRKRDEPHRDASPQTHRAGSQRPPSSGLPLWSDSFERDGVTYPYTMVGRDPHNGPSTTTIRALLVPIRFVFEVQGDFSTNVFDASTDLVDGQTAIDGILKSPIFTPYPFTIAGQYVGTTQLADAYVRANFWTELGPRRDYHLLLAPEVMPTQTINVPVDDEWEGCDGVFDEPTGTCAGVWRPFVPYDFLIAQLTSLLGQISATPDVIPMFITGAVDSTLFAGAHPSEAGGQTWIWSTYMPNDAWGGHLADVSVLGHEVLEWLNDPFANNDVPGWPMGPVSYTGWCYARNLEVGDPLENDTSTAAIPFPGPTFTYHLPDAVFIDFFTHKRSRSAGGLYSLFGNAPGPSPSCIGDTIYQTTFVDVPGATVTMLTGINDAEDIVGLYWDQSLVFHGFVRRHERFSTLNGPAAIWTVPSAINDFGQIAGYFSDGTKVHAFLLTGGSYQTIDFPGAIGTYGLNLNRLGDVVGEYVDVSGSSHGFLFRNGTFTTVNAPAGVQSLVSGINDYGDLSIESFDATGALVGSYLRTAAGFSLIRFPGDTHDTAVAAVDNRGRTTGTFSTDWYGGTDAFVTQADGSYVRLPRYQINGMNNHGQIVGLAEDGHGFIATLPGDHR
jgi:hypothetical protein